MHVLNFSRMGVRLGLLILLLGMGGGLAALYWPSPKSDCEHAFELLRRDPEAVPLDQLLISCERAVSEHPDDPHQFYLYGKTLTYIASDSEAVAHFRQAATAAHHPAQHELGLAYLYGRGVPYDPVSARRWLLLATNGGYAPAQRQLARLLQIGEGGEQNQEQAFHWYQQAAEQDDTEAQIELSLAYRRGAGSHQDNEQALHWLQRAAQAGSPNAQYMLAMEYFSGQIVSQDYAQALQWMQSAEANGYGAAERGFFNNGLCTEIGSRN